MPLARAIAGVILCASCATGQSDYGSAGGGASVDAESLDPDAGVDSSRSDGSLPEGAAASAPDASDSVDAADAVEGVDAVAAADAFDAVDAAAPGDASAEIDSSPPACTGVEIACNGSCVNPTNDPGHCGGCGTVCSSGLCGASIAADMSSSPPGWVFNGSAALDTTGPSARMTAAGAASATGTVIYGHAVATDQFTANFQFRIGAGGGGRYDGMGFMIEASGATAIGSGDGALGMGGLTGYGVELDVYDNGQCGDGNADHVGIDALAFCSSSSSLPTSLFASPDLTSTVDLADGKWHAATVSLAAGAMSVSVDTKSVANDVSLTGFASGTPYYYGFAGATGGVSGNGGVRTEVKAVTITFPTPRCL